MTLKMCILTNQANLNNALFTDDFIDGVITNKEKYIGIPLVANRTKLENGLFNVLSHEFDQKSGELKTDSIGSFVDFWDETDTDGSRLLMGTVRVLKRFPNVCNAIIELYDQGELEFSCEVLVFGYSDVTDSIRSISYVFEDQTNELFASCVVTNPAEPKSTATMLVAEALIKDLEGGVKLSKTEIFNKGIEIKFHGSFESASLKYSDVADQIYNILNPIDPKTGYREYEYWVSDLYTDYVIVEDWNSYETLYKISYQIINDTVVLDTEDMWIKGTKGFIPDSIDSTSENELSSIVVAQKEEKVKMDEDMLKLQETNAELIKTNEALLVYKEKFEASEKQVKKDVLVEKFSKILSEESLKSEVVVKAFEELDEATLNSVVVSEVTKEIASKTTTDKKDVKVIVSARMQDDLVPQSTKDRLYAAKSE